MLVLTKDRMRSVDAGTIAAGTPGLTLMRAAGMAVCKHVRERHPEADNIVVVAGTGNNGGDGFHAAELLLNEGLGVTVFLVGKEANIRGDARTCLGECRASGVQLHILTEQDGLSTLDKALTHADVVVDALFGIGFHGSAEGLDAAVIASVNASRVPVIAVDLPSGVNADTGAVTGTAIIADATVTFGALKPGLVRSPGRRWAGDVSVADIGFLPHFLEPVPGDNYALTPGEASALFPERPFDLNKRSAGRVLVVAGSEGMTGAAALTTMAAMRVGAGFVTLACPAGLADIYASKLTEALIAPLPEVTKRHCLSTRALGTLREKAMNTDALVIGPGLGVHHETTDLVRRFIAGYDGIVVLDASGIGAFAGKPDLLRKSPARLVLTPHAGEIARLMGVDSDIVIDNPEKILADAAAATGAGILLKGPTTFINTTTGERWISPTGNEGMATAGAGDVLAGIIAGFASQGMTPDTAAVLGAYVHGHAGDMAAVLFGMRGMTAGDILELVPDAVADLAPAPYPDPLRIMRERMSGWTI